MTTVDDIEFIVPCGGKSTRNYPHSKGLPHKSFMPFGDGRLIDRILADIVHAGGRHITIVCSGSDVVERFREALAPDPDMVEKFESFRFNGWRVTNFEMEGSAIAGIAAHLGHNAGTVCCIIANRHLKSSNPDYKPYIRQLVELVLDRLTR